MHELQMEGSWKGTRQRKRCIAGFVYSAGASKDVFGKLYPVIE